MIQYVVVNDAVRTVFEKETELPFGYAMSFFFSNLKDALQFVDSLDDEDDICKKENYVIERWEAGEKEIVWPELS